jgi:hypothetical protein
MERDMTDHADIDHTGLTGVGASAAADVSITDSGGYFTGTDVEAALQELGAGGGGGGGGTTQAYVGYNTVGGSVETLTTNRQYMKQIVLANDCLLTSIDVHIKGDATNVFWWTVAVCEDNAGEFGNVVSDLPLPGTNVFLNTTFRWFSSPMGVWLPAGTYWIGFLSTAAVQIHYDTGGSDRYHDHGQYIADGDRAAQTNSTRKYSIRANTIR